MCSTINLVNTIIDSTYDHECSNKKFDRFLLTKQIEKISTEKDAYVIMSPILRKYYGCEMEEESYEENVWNGNVITWINITLDQIKEIIN